jgi:hypothetical protein
MAALESAIEDNRIPLITGGVVSEGGGSCDDTATVNSSMISSELLAAFVAE